MKVGDKISAVELELRGYTILTKFGCGFIWKRKDGLGKHLMWNEKEETITLMYGDDERYNFAI